MSVSVRKPFSIGLVLLGALTAALLFTAAPALAAEAPKVEEQWVTHVSATAATLEAKINPGGGATTYKFEYATSEASLLAGKGEVVPAPPSAEGEAGAGTAGVVVEEHPQGLEAHTNYWYRVVARNGDGRTLGCEAPGTCLSFTTQTASGELGAGGLPDHRAWELVSPPPGSDGDAISVQPFVLLGGVIQAANNGGAITYLSYTASEPEPEGLSNFSQILSVRRAGGGGGGVGSSSSDGWSSRDITTPHHVASGFSSDDGGQEYRFFSADLSVGLVEPLGSGNLGKNLPVRRYCRRVRLKRRSICAPMRPCRPKEQSREYTVRPQPKAAISRW